MKDFKLGCNYWASHAGIEMWKNWDAEQVEKDLAVLSANGVSTMRVFPLWRDFQPVMAVYAQMGDIKEYMMEGLALFCFYDFISLYGVIFLYISMHLSSNRKLFSKDCLPYK